MTLEEAIQEELDNVSRSTEDAVWAYINGEQGPTSSPEFIKVQSLNRIMRMIRQRLE